jgi:aminoglycoside/choline kinase family phosphotransferase
MDVCQKSSRFSALKHWLTQCFKQTDIALTPMTGDAGFRHYYRFSFDGRSYIAVDAPPEQSNNEAFVMVQQAFDKQHIPVPQLIEIDLNQGFFCLSDFGDILLADVLAETQLAVLQELSAESMENYYKKAIDLLPIIAQVKTAQPLPVYDKPFIHRELTIFKEWLLEVHLEIILSNDENEQLQKCFDFLINSALSQPQVTMHRDYHSRNIMLLTTGSLGIIDFQDAVQGPITYDIVSLLRDCYTRWPDEKIAPLLEYFRQLLIDSAHPPSIQYNLANISQKQWQTWFDLMGLQRHIKASGIFARLFHRDNKTGYLNDIPLTLSYISDVSAHYPELKFLHRLIIQKVLPTMQLKNRPANINTFQKQR